MYPVELNYGIDWPIWLNFMCQKLNGPNPDPKKPIGLCTTKVFSCKDTGQEFHIGGINLEVSPLKS